MKTVTLLVLITICTIPTFAQPPGGGQGRGRQFTEEDVRQRVERNADSLDLTDEQEQKILAFELEYFKKGQEMRENFDPETSDREEMRAYMMKQREERMEKYAEVLTEEQMKKFTEMQDRRRQNMRRRMEEDSGGRGRGRGRG
jgi:Spy/CpxP family protein refolding chaperone